MKLVISKDGIKRELHTPFVMCSSPEELERLGRHLIGHAHAMRGEGITYGTINVYPDVTLGGPSNTPPLAWTDR